jgi:Tfp pilus assembly protein PilF
MPNTAITNLEKLLAAGKDSALLRFGLGTEYLKAGDAGTAMAHLRRALELDGNYSAAWKVLGQALTQLGQDADALAAYRAGIGVAEARGDKQAAKEMQVFARRLEKAGR